MRYLFVLTGLATLSAFAATEVNTVEQIVAKVNGDIVTTTDLTDQRSAMEIEYQRQGLRGTELRSQLDMDIPNILREKIDNLLLVQHAKDLDIKVDSEVNREIANAQRSTNIADPEKFQQFVREQTGKSYEDYKASVKERFLAQAAVREEVYRKITFKTEDLRAYYDANLDKFQRQERVFLREILVAVKDWNDQLVVNAAQKKADDLVSRARKGEKFPDLAQVNSDASTAPNGGELSPYNKGQMSAELENLVWDKEKAYVTDPIKIGPGFLILKVDGHPKAGLADFEEVQSSIQDFLLQSRIEPALRAFLTRLRQNSFLEIKPGYDDTGAAPGKDTTWQEAVRITPQTVTRKEVIEQGTRKKILGIPIPGTKTHEGTSSSR